MLVRKGRRRSEERLLVCRNEDRALTGSYSLSQIFYGPFRNACLGYYAFVPFAGHGYIREGLRLVIEYAFDALNLHRLQVNIQPANEPSIALVGGAGFSKEGFSPRYLFIDATGATTNNGRSCPKIAVRERGGPRAEGGSALGRNRLPPTATAQAH